MADKDWKPAIDNWGRVIGDDTYRRDYSLTFAYAIEEAYKKDSKGYASIEEFAAHTIAEMVECCLLRKGKAYEMFAAKREASAAFGGCKSSTEYMLYCIESAIMAHSAIDDEFFDCYSPLIDKHSAAILAAHPELTEDAHESIWFE